GEDEDRQGVACGWSLTVRRLMEVGPYSDGFQLLPGKTAEAHDRTLRDEVVAHLAGEEPEARRHLQRRVRLQVCPPADSSAVGQRHLTADPRPQARAPPAPPVAAHPP